jgi:hypothetical protein
MHQIYRYIIAAIVFISITGCPPPPGTFSYYKHPDDNTKRIRRDGNFINIDRAYSTRFKEKRAIIIQVSGYTISEDTLQFVCSKSVVYSKSDTFFAQHNKDSLLNWKEIARDTVPFYPRKLQTFFMCFVSKKMYWKREVNRTNTDKSDTVRIRFNLFDKLDTTFYLPPA